MKRPPDCLLDEPDPTPLHILIILGVGFLAWSNSFHGPFVFDDLPSIVNNSLIRELDRFFTDPSVFLAFPRRFLGYLSLAVNFKIGGLATEGYHIVNLLLHLSSTLALYAFCRMLLRTPYLAASPSVGGSPHLSLIAALLFVAHPIQTQAVTYITQRFTVIATLFYLLALTCYLRSRTGQADDAVSPAWYASAILCAICAMLSKEIAFTLPIAVGLLECFFFSGMRRRITRLGPFFALLAIIPLLILFGNSHAPQQVTHRWIPPLQTGISQSDYLTTQPAVFATYLRLMLVPVNQTLDYDYPLVRSLAEPQAAGGLILLLALTLLACCLYRQTANLGARLTAFGIFWFLLALSVESFVPLDDLINEHRLYLPSAGAAIAAAGFLSLLARRVSARSIAITSGIIITLLALTTWKRNLVWSDEILLWSDAVAKAPGKARPHYNLGTVLSNRGVVDAAEEEFKAALAIDPQHAKARYNLGVLRASRGDTAEAKTHYETALRLEPSLAEAHNSLGVLLAAQGRLPEAIGAYRDALKLMPNLADARNNLGAALAAAGDLEGAAVELAMAIGLSADNASYHENLARVYELQGMKEKAGEEMRFAESLRKKRGIR